jgi:hypothetical protein
MPFIHDCSQTKGQAEPASAYLSPVARDYPNRALRGFFMPTALRAARHAKERARGRRPHRRHNPGQARPCAARTAGIGPLEPAGVSL